MPSAATHTVLRCAAGPEIGLGHVSRCIALAQAFADAGVPCRAAMAPDFPNVRQLIALCNLPFVAAPMAADDAAAVGQLAGPHGVVVLDGYHFSSAYSQHIAAAGARRIVFIDDVFTWDTWPVPYVLAFSAISIGRTYGWAKAFVGPAYTPIKRPYKTLRSQTQHARQPSTCLIALGGLDIHNQLVPLALGAATLFKNVWLADSVGLTAAARQRLQGCPAIAILPPQPDLAEPLARCEVAIVGGGMTKYEAIFMATPSLVVDQTALQHDDTVRLNTPKLVDQAPLGADLGAVLQALQILANDPARRQNLAKACLTANFGGKVSAMVADIASGT